MEKHADTSLKRKKVAFILEGSEQQKTTYLPLAHSNKHRKRDPYKVITELWVKLGRNNKYDELRHTLISNNLGSRDTMIHFFHQEGSYLLMNAILYQSKPDALQFICENVPEDKLREILQEENYSALGSLLIGLTALEQKGRVDQKEFEGMIAKVKLLLKVDFEGLSNYMESEYFKKHYSEGVKRNFRETIKTYNSVKPSVKKY